MSECVLVQVAVLCAFLLDGSHFIPWFHVDLQFVEQDRIPAVSTIKVSSVVLFPNLARCVVPQFNVLADGVHQDMDRCHNCGRVVACVGNSHCIVIRFFHSVTLCEERCIHLYCEVL